MGLKIALPTADLIGVAGATTSLIDSTTVQLDPNTIYVTGTAEAATLSVSIPATANDGDVILIKNLGEGDVNIPFCFYCFNRWNSTIRRDNE